MTAQEMVHGSIRRECTMEACTLLYLTFPLLSITEDEQERGEGTKRKARKVAQACGGRRRLLRVIEKR